MRIALIGQKGIPATFGGVEKHVDELSRGLASAGHDVRVYVRDWYTPKNLKVVDGVRLLHVPTIHSKHLDAAVHSFLCTLHAVVSGADIIHFHAIGPSIFSILSRLFGRKTVATIHRLDWATDKWKTPAKLALKAGEWISVRFPQRTIVVSEELRHYIHNKYGREAIHISHGIRLPAPVPAEILRTKFGLKEKGYILFMSRLVPEKRADWMVRAFREQKKKGFLPGEIKLVIAGGEGGSPAYVQRLKDIAEGAPDVVFTGYATGRLKEELLSQAMLFVLPSDLEGFPIVLMEAMSYGLACLCSDIVPHREAVRNGVDGQLFRTADFSDFGAKLRELVERPERRKALGDEALARMRKRPSWMDVVRQTEAVYRTIR